VLLQQYERRFLENIFTSPTYIWCGETESWHEFSLRRDMVLDVLMYPLRTHMIERQDILPVRDVYTSIRQECFDMFQTVRQLKKKFIDQGIPEDILHYVFEECLSST
jgi:hypothetical protein